jgi:hypothetical protein
LTFLLAYNKILELRNNSSLKMPDPAKKNEPLQARIVVFSADLCLLRLRILKNMAFGLPGQRHLPPFPPNYLREITCNLPLFFYQLHTLI